MTDSSADKTDDRFKKLIDCMDAKVWAEAFMQTWGGHVIGKSDTVDEGLMLAWFANSIMAGFDEASRRQQKHIDKLKALMLLTDQAVSHVEMNKLSATQFDAYERWCQTQS